MLIRYLAVLDFEATCDVRSSPDWDIDSQEIIEVPIALVSVTEKEIVARFHAFARPTVQPALTPFCQELTSIQQADVDAAQPIGLVMAELTTWLKAQGADHHNTMVVTCGDWDLQTMWPRQVSLCPEITTPAVFRSWCNLKKVFQQHLGRRKPSGMMGMLSVLGIPHRGHHHRGADDVENLCSLVIALLHRGVAFAPTWSPADRSRQASRWAKKQEVARQALRDKRAALSQLPAHVASGVRASLEYNVRALAAEVERLETLRRCFSEE